MKTANILLSLVVMGTVTLGFADANTPTGIDAQITAIQSAKPEDRVALMNQFKTQLSNMNAEDRSAAISQMQIKMRAHSQDVNHQKNGTHQKQIHEHAGEMQSNHNEGMNRIQNMNQQQVGNHYGQDMRDSGAKMEHGNAAGGRNMKDVGQNYINRDH